MHSTLDAMIDLLTSTFDNINNHQYTALLFLDLKKAFDTVNHEILINIMDHYGIRGTAKTLFTSFLTKRNQYVSINNVSSTTKPINCEVPQGSVLGPLLFTLFINDICKSTSCNPRLFVDDTCLILQDKHLSALITKINNELNAINEWIVANKLTLNLSKSNIIIVNSTCDKKDRNLSHYLNANISSGIAAVDDVKYLGVIFEKNLNFDCHIYNLEKKLSRSGGILAKVKPFFNSKTLLQLYYAIFHSHLKYGISAWRKN